MTIIKSAVKGLEDRITEIAERAFAKYRKAVHPIYGVRRDSPAHIGTCFFLRVGLQRYIVTAAHVVDEAEHSPLYVPVGGRLIAIDGAFACTSAPNGIRDNDLYDFAYATAHDEYFQDVERVACFEESDISLNRVAVDTRAYMAIGYPRSKNKDPNHAKQSLDPKIWHYYATGRAVPEMYARLGVSGDDHIAIKYEQQSHTAEGELVNTISARGMSGGSLIDLGPQRPSARGESSSFSGLLSGVLIERGFDEHVLLFVKIQLIVDRIHAGIQKDACISPDRSL